MEGVKLLLTITAREFAEQYVEFFKNKTQGISLNFFAQGTASTSMLDYFGLENNEKIAFMLLVRDSDIAQIKYDLKNEMDIASAGNGIAVFIPVDAIGGEWSKKNLIGEAPLEKGEEKMINDNQSKLVLIITIVDKGNTETVMDAAREKGATGGTVVRAKGTGAQVAKFFGVSISEEKEMVYIVCKRELRSDIMHAIMEKAGGNTDAHGIVFSLPVDSVCGVRSLEE